MCDDDSREIERVGVDAEDFDLSNITDDENESQFSTPVCDTDEVIPIWSDETENCVYRHCSFS